MFKLSTLTLLVCSLSLSAAQPTIQANDIVYGEVNDWIFFTVTTDGKGVKIVPLNSGLSFFPSDKLKNPNEIGVRAKEAAVYKVLVYTGNADGPSEPKIIQVVVGNVNPGPVTPPVPKPVDPPTPVPTIDPLAKALKDAYIAETAADKRERLRAFANVMREAAIYATDTNIGTNDALAKKVSARTTEKIDGSLLSLRKKVGEYLGNEFPREVVTLNQALRDKFVIAYTKIATILDSIE